MSDPRWTDEAHALAVAIHDAVCHDRTCPATVIAAVYGTSAVAALDHLRAAGLLVQPGGETRTEYRYGGWYGLDEALACTLHAEGKEVETRDIIEYPGSWRPWQPATQEAPHAR